MATNHCWRWVVVQHRVMGEIIVIVIVIVIANVNECGW